MSRKGALVASWVTIMVFVALAQPLLTQRFGFEALLVIFTIVAVLAGITTYAFLQWAGKIVNKWWESAETPSQSDESEPDASGGERLDDELVESEVRQLKDEQQ
jgi:hypothetical protein